MVKAARTVFIIGSRVDGNDYKSLLQDSEVPYQIIKESSEERVIAVCRLQQIDVIVLEFCDRNRSLETLERVKSELGENCPPIVAVGINDAEIAIEAIKLGATDYLVRKRITSRKLAHTLEKAMGFTASEAIADSSDRTQRSGTRIESALELLPKIIEHLPVGAVFVVDRDLRYLLAVGEALNSAGFKPEDLVGQTIYEVIPPELIAEHEELYRIGFRGETFTREHEAHGKTYVSRGTPLRNSRGEIYAVLAVSYDITERKRAEAAIQRSPAQLASNLAGMMQLHRLNQRLLHVDRLEEILQNILTVAAEFTQTNKGNIQLINTEESGLEIIVHQGHSQAFLNHFAIHGSEAICESARRKKQRIIVEDVVLEPTLQGTADLDIFHHDGIRAVQSTPIIDREGQLIGMLNNHYAQPYRPSETELQLLDLLAQTAADFIEQRQIKTDLRESEAKYSTLFESINDGFTIIQMLYDEDNKPIDYRFLEVSPSFEVHTGLVNAKGKTAKKLLPNLEAMWFNTYSTVAQTCESIHFENYSEVMNRWFEVYAFPYSKLEDRQVAIVFTDISDRKQSEEALRELEIQRVREQAEREKERNRAETIAELDRAKTEFFSNISHEFRTPLTLLLAPLQDALEDLNHSLPESHRQRLELARRNALHLLKLVNTLLDFSCMEAGQLQANYELVDLATHTIDLASTFRSAIENAGLRLVVDCPPLSEPVYVDLQMWSKIISNLLSNAFKFTFSGTITVSLKPQATTSDNLEKVELTVSDTGVGIPAADLSHIFERFYQSKGTKGRSYEGSGIGLSLVQELVELHKGEIEVSSEVDRGTTFRVTLPAGTDHLPPERLGHTFIPTSTAMPTLFVSETEHWLPEESTTVGSQDLEANLPRILIVDDNADLRNYLQRLLSKYYQVETVNDGLAALTAIGQATQSYDLVLTDFIMPVMDGIELLRSLRADPDTKDIPIIVLSARVEEESQIAGLEAGADDYLFKPFSARELLARVKTNLELTQMRREVTYRKQVMQEIQTLNKTLEYRVQERTARLKAINQELESFSYSVSHELQAPLRYISNFAQKLQEQFNSIQIDPTSQRYLKIIKESAEQSRHMVYHLLEFSRLEQTQMLFASVSMEQLVRQVCEQLQPELIERSLQWQIEPLPEVWGDREMLRLVWQNLLSNAVKYTRDCGAELSAHRTPEITVGSFKHDNEIVFFVRDNGVGFDMKYHERLFTLFQRLHSQKFSGTGVGLAHVRRIIHRHGGKIWAEGAVDEGATFYFSMSREQRTVHSDNC